MGLIGQLIKKFEADIVWSVDLWHDKKQMLAQLKSLDPNTPIAKIKIETGETIWLVTGRRKPVKNGILLVLTNSVKDIGEGPPPPEPNMLKREIEMEALSRWLGEKLAIEPGRFRTTLNGPEQRTRPYSHVLITFPVGDDKMARGIINLQEIEKDLTKVLESIRENLR